MPATTHHLDYMPARAGTILDPVVSVWKHSPTYQPDQQFMWLDCDSTPPSLARDWLDCDSTPPSLALCCPCCAAHIPAHLGLDPCLGVDLCHVIHARGLTHAVTSMPGA